MNALKKASATLLFLIGISIFLLGTMDLLNSNASEEDRSGALAAITLFGLPSVGAASFLIWSLRREHHQSLQQKDLQKEQIFLQLLQSSQTVTVTSFALAAQIPIEESKQFLDQKARQLNGDFEVSEEGSVHYRFPK